MAIKKIQIKPPDNSYADILHPETDSVVVLMTAGETLEDFKTATNISLGQKALSTHNHTGVYATAAQGTLATNALPKAGGTLSGTLFLADNILSMPLIKDYSESLTTNATATGAVTLDISTANNFNLTISGAASLTFSNPSATGTVCSITIKINMPATLYAITFPASVKWDNDIIPTFVVSKTAICTFVTFDGGTRWYGVCTGTKFTT